MAQLRIVAPQFIRLELELEGDYVRLTVWEADDARYLSRAEHALTYGPMTPSDCIEAIAATLDSLGLPDPF